MAAQKASMVPTSRQYDGSPASVRTQLSSNRCATALPFFTMSGMRSVPKSWLEFPSSASRIRRSRRNGHEKT